MSIRWSFFFFLCSMSSLSVASTMSWQTCWSLDCAPAFISAEYYGRSAEKIPTWGPGARLYEAEQDKPQLIEQEADRPHYVSHQSTRPTIMAYSAKRPTSQDYSQGYRFLEEYRAEHPQLNIIKPDQVNQRELRADRTSYHEQPLMRPVMQNEYALRPHYFPHARIVPVKQALDRPAVALMNWYPGRGLLINSYTGSPQLDPQCPSSNAVMLP